MTAANEEFTLDTVMALMKRGAEDAEVQIKCLKWFTQYLVGHGRGNLGRSDYDEIVEACVRTCSTHPEDPEVQFEAVHTLMHFCSCECNGSNGDGCDIKNALLEKKGVSEAVSSAKKKYQSITKLQMMADAILICCSFGDKDASALEMSKDALRNTVNAMTAHIDEPNLQEMALLVIRVIIDSCPTDKREELLVFGEKAGTLGVVLDAMRRAKHCPRVLYFAMRLLSTLSQNGNQYRQSTIDFLWSHQALPLVISSLASFAEMCAKEISNDEIGVYMHLHTCRVIGGMFSFQTPAEPDLPVLASRLQANIHNTDCVVASLAVLLLATIGNKENGRILGKRYAATVFDSVNKHEGDVQVLQFAMDTFMAVAQASNKLKAYVTHRGGVTLALSLMQKYTDQVSLQGVCMDVLAILLDESNSALTAKQMRSFCQQAVEESLKAVSQHPDDYHFVDKTCACLQKLSALRFFDDVMYEARGAEFLIRCIKTHVDSLSVLWTVFTMLRHLIEKHRDLQSVCAQQGAIDAVLKVVRKHKSESQEFLLHTRGILIAMTENNVENTAYLKQAMPGSKAKLLRSAFECGHCLVARAVEQRTRCTCCHTDQKTWARSMNEIKKIVENKSEIIDDVVKEYERLRVTEPCAGCGKTAAVCGLERLMQCSACTIAPKYCSAACQKACWPAHKAECKANRSVD
jgi:hypothetical protein